MHLFAVQPPTAERRKESRVNIDNAVAVRGDDLRRDFFHVPGKHDEVDAVLLEHGEQGLDIGGFCCEMRRSDVARGYAVLLRPFEGLCGAVVADAQGESGVQLPGLDAVDERLEI